MQRLSFFASPGLFRFALALTVFVHHLSRLAIGAAAVYVFFVLSGFWIAQMWRFKYRRTSSPYTVFLVSRLWRVLPVFVVCSALAWLLLYARGGATQSDDAAAHQVLSNLFMLGYRSLALQANVPAWSLDIETQFYLLAPVLIACLTRSLWFAAVAVAAAAFAAKLGDGVSLAPYLGYFVLGIVASLTRWTPSAALGLLSVVATLLAMGGLIVSPWRGVVLAGTHITPDYVWNPVACAILALVLAPFAIYTTSQRSSAVDVALGELSFIVYLLHFPILDWIGTGGGSSWARASAVAEVMALIAVAALAVYYAVDRPLNTMRSRWVARKVAGNPHSAA